MLLKEHLVSPACSNGSPKALQDGLAWSLVDRPASSLLQGVLTQHCQASLAGNGFAAGCRGQIEGQDAGQLAPCSPHLPQVASMQEVIPAQEINLIAPVERPS